MRVKTLLCALASLATAVTRPVDQVTAALRGLEQSLSEERCLNVKVQVVSENRDVDVCIDPEQPVAQFYEREIVSKLREEDQRV